MNTQLTATQIFDLMSEQPGSAEGRDAARAAVARLDPSETKVLVQRIVDAAQPESPDHPAFAVPFVRGYLLGQLGKIVEENKAGINLLLRHVQPEFEPDHWVRYWAFTGCIAAGTPKVTEVAQWALRQFGQGDPGPDHKLLVLSCAVFWAQKRDPQWETHLTTPLRAWLQAAARGNGQVPLDIQGRCQDVLRVLEICPVLPTVGLVTEVLNRQGSDPRTRLLAVQALGALPEAARAERGRATRALLTFVQNSGNTRTLAGVRRAAVEALGDLGLADAEYLLLKELRAGSLDMIKAAARALVQVIGLEKAVQRILEASLADNNPHSRNNYAISLRWMSEDKAAVTDLLHQSLATGSPDQEEITRTLMAEMGGSAAVQKLSARKKAVDDFKTMLLGEQDKFQKRFDETMEEARTGFRIAISMDVVVFGLGIVMLVAFMIYAFITDTVDNFVGVGLGGLGTLGVVYGTLIANPRKKVFRSVNTLMNFKVIFLAYLRQLHQADQTFTRHLLEDEQLTTDKLEEFSSMIAAMLEEAVDKMTRLKQQELKEKVADFDAEYKMRSLDVKQRIAEVKYGYGRKYDAPARPASPPPPAPEYAPPTAEQAASTGPENGTESPQSWFSTPAAEKSVPPAAEESVPPTPEESPLLIAESEPESAPALSPYAQARARVAAAPRTASSPPPAEPRPPVSPPPAAEARPPRTPAAPNDAVPEAFLAHLRLREGWRTKVYLDSLGKPTAGLGHLLTVEEKRRYPVGAEVPEATLRQWAQQDARKAYRAAQDQATQLKVDSEPLVQALASVNFQLGTAWKNKFKKTWSLLQAHRWNEAVREVEDSAWFRQTPVRVRDFQKALRGLAASPSATPARPPASPAARTAPPPAAPSGATIEKSVGHNAENRAADVRTIQAQLLALGYLRDPREYQALASKPADETVRGLAQTTEAIREFQAYGMGVRRADGKVDPGGNTLRRLQARLKLMTEFRNYQIGTQEIAPVLRPEQWISQFPDVAASSKGRGLRESEKAYAGKKNSVCCWDTANAMVKQKVSGIQHDVSDRIATFHQKDGQGFAMAQQSELGAKYIDREISAGRPVMVGVDDGRTASYNADNTTEHYVVIVGKVIRNQKVYYQYFDPGSRHGAAKGYNPTNLLELGSDFILRGPKPGGGKTYTVAQVRQNRA